MIVVEARGSGGEVMPEYQHLIVGGGMAADAAVRGIRERDATGSIGLVGAEPQAPYSRPPLSKALWKGEPVESIWRGTDALDVTLHLGRRIARLEPAAHRATDEQGVEYTFEKALLATGGTPRRLPGAGDGVVYFRTFADYERLRALAAPGRRIAVIGGGFIGSEVAAALALVGAAPVMIFPDAGITARAFGPELSRFVTEAYRSRGVEVLAGESVRGIAPQGDGALVTTGSGREISVAGVVAGLGIEPNVGLAEAAGLTCSDGILVDAQLRTTHPDVYAAGDVANVFSDALGRRVRVEHEDAALTMGKAAGRAMAGDLTPYTHLPFFYSDLFDMGYEAVGILDARLEMVADWKEPFREGVVYYLEQGRVRGVLLWNAWGQVDAARALISEPGPFRPEDLRGRIAA
jgi:3-phenylpropionate/trans-cinnamate dioxygenase ferredoxin reductase component